MAGFESGVNPEGIQTPKGHSISMAGFESGVNPEGIQTSDSSFRRWRGLRVV